MVGVGRDLYGSSSPTLLLKQGHLQQAAEDLVQAGLEYLQIFESCMHCTINISIIRKKSLEFLLFLLNEV